VHSPFLFLSHKNSHESFANAFFRAFAIFVSSVHTYRDGKKVEALDNIEM